MPPFIVAGAVIAVCATALSWLFDSKTEEESKRNKELKNNLNELKNKFNISEDTHSKNLGELACNNFNAIKTKFLDELAFFKEEKKDVKNDLEKLALAIRQELKNEAISPYQKQSLLQNRNRIEDAKNRLHAYWLYLEWFEQNLQELEQEQKYQDILNLELPQPLLPEDYLYLGKLAYIFKNEISIGSDKSKGWNKYKQKLQLNDYKNKNKKESNTIDGFEDDQEFIILIEDTKDNKHFSASVIKGELYQCILENMSFEVQPKNTEKQNQEKLALQYKDVVLNIKREDKLYPLKQYKWHDGFEVKIKEYDLLLEEVLVTEKYNEDAKETSSGIIPCIFHTSESISVDFIEKIDTALQVHSFQAVSIEENYLTLKLDNYKLFIKIEKDNYLLLLQEITYFDVAQISSDAFTIPYEILLVEKNLYDEKYKKMLLNQEVVFNELISFLGEQFNYITYSSRTENKDFDFFKKWQRIIDYQIEDNSYEALEIQFSKYDKNENIIHFYTDSALKEHERKFEDKKPREILIELNGTNIGYLDDYSINDGFLKAKIDFIELLPNIPHNGTIIIKVKSSQAVLQKQKKALKDFSFSKIVNKDIKQLLISPELIQYKPIASDFKIDFKNKNLTDNQKEIIKKAFNEKNIFLVQGPPGTGKTTVIKELIYQTIKHNEYSKILIVSQQNVAVDNVLDGIDRENKEWFTQEGHSIVRVASNEDKIQYDNIKEYTIEKWFDKYKEIVKDNFIKIEQNKNDKLNENNKKLFDFAMDWMSLIQKADFRDVDDEIKELLLSKHQILGATCVGLANKSLGLDLVEFDIAIIDEAGRATAPELLIPILRAKKIILIGDQNQLPPTIDRKLLEKIESDDENDLSSEDLAILKKSFFEELFEKTPESNKAMLKEQFRMPEQIGNLISQLFYDNKLYNGHIKQTNSFVDPKNIIRWINIDGKHEIDGKSSYNSKEVDGIEKLLGHINEHLKKKGLTKSIGIITPYSAQKRKIRAKIKTLSNISSLKIDTVDSFQGEEADIVIYSTVKTYGNISFLIDKKRLNVAISRTKENLFFVGKRDFFYNAKTTTDEINLFKKIIEYIQ